MGSLLQHRNQRAIIIACSIIAGSMLALYGFCQALWNFTFWSGSGVMQHTVAYLTDIGYSSDCASKTMSAVMLCTTIAKPAFGSLMDRLGIKVGTVLIGISLGAPFSALLFDSFSTYRPAWAIYAAAMVLALFILQFAMRRVSLLKY